MKIINSEFGKIKLSDIQENQINELESRIMELIKVHVELELDLLFIYNENNKEYKSLDPLCIDELLEFTTYIPLYMSRIGMLESRIDYLNTLVKNAKNNIFE